MSILQVVGRKVVVLENPLRLDVVGFQDVTQESRDVARSVAGFPGGVGRSRDLGSWFGGEQIGDHRHGLGHGNQVRASSGEFHERNGLG